MGFYIETDGHNNKANWILKNCKDSYVAPITLDINVPKGFVPVVVMDNGAFEAAGVAFDQKELNDFIDPRDGRPKQLLMVKREDVIRECPYVESSLAWWE